MCEGGPNLEVEAARFAQQRAEQQKPPEPKGTNMPGQPLVETMTSQAPINNVPQEERLVGDLFGNNRVAVLPEQPLSPQQIVEPQVRTPLKTAAEIAMDRNNVPKTAYTGQPGERGVLVGEEIKTDTQGQANTETKDEQDLPQSEEEMIERFRNMSDGEKIQTAKDGLVGMIADETLPREQRDFYEALLHKGDQAILAYANGEMDRRVADKQQGTALVPYVPEAAQQLVNEGALTREEAGPAQERAVMLLTDGKGPKNKEGIKSYLIQATTSIGVNYLTEPNFGINGLFNSIFQAMAGK